MQIVHNILQPVHASSSKKESILSRFINWADSQEKNRFGWVAAILAIHGCVLAPITVLVMVFAANNMLSWGFVIGAMAIALISNLAAMPTKVTIPVFFLSVLIDLFVIAASLFSLAS